MRKLQEIKVNDMVRQGTDWFIIDGIDDDGTLWGSRDDDPTPTEIIRECVDVHAPAGKVE
jgi:hypothetical protein